VRRALTLEQIASLARVSRSTVSRVVNNQPGVRDDVRERVWTVIRQTGYQPHAAARSLVTRRTQMVAVIIPETVNRLFTDPFFPRLLAGIASTCNNRHYHLMLALFNGADGQAEMYGRVVGGGHLDGVIVASAHTDDPLFTSLLKDGVPFVLAGRHPDERVNYVDVDNVGGARMAVEHLIRLGHTRIATITGPLIMAHGEDRLQGYRQALEAHRLPVDERLIVEGDYTEESGSIGMQRLLAASPTALFAASDVMAIGALKALREAGLRVPEDVALVGFDDLSIASAVVPALTTVRQPIEHLGSMAADLLLNSLATPPGAHAPANRLILPTKLVVRDSCGAMQ
jgi:LacI family transcriptional regulator